MTAVLKKVPIARCERYLRIVVRLGFTDLIQECLVRLPYCRYLIERGEMQLAKRALRALAKKCAKIDSASMSGLGELMGTIDRLLAECGSG